MTSFQRSAACLLLAAFAGCGPSAPNITPRPEAPHSGAYFPIPDGLGYVEILKQSVPGSKGKSKIVAYFLDPSRNVMTTTPTTVSLKLLAIGETPFSLKPTGETDPAKAGGLATEPIPDRDGLDGDLSATIDGKSVIIPITIR